jgi:uncharacterized protein involved in outer membrane biogenesis
MPPGSSALDQTLSKPLKTIGLAVGALIGLLVLVAIALRLFLDVNAYKPRIEAAASRISGMDVKVGGPMGVDFFPTLRITLEDVHIRNKETELASAKLARIGVDFLPLLHQEIRINRIALEHPILSIEKNRDGTFNFKKPQADRSPLPSQNLAKVSFSDATLRYKDLRTGTELEADDCRVDASRVQLSGGERPGLMRQLSLAAEVVCGAVRTNNHTGSDLKFSVTGQRGIFDLEPLTMRAFAGRGSGSIKADFTGSVPRYHVRYALSQFHIDEFLKPVSPQNSVEGSMDFTANLTMQGKTVNRMRQTMAGRISLHGSNLILNGRDLDQAFDRYESSQAFNLVDVGAFFFAGPAGLVVTKGYNFASILQGSEGRSEIRTLVSDWKVERGIALSQDVAMATKAHRVALQGGLDFVNERFDGVTVALIDDKGCIKAQQTIHGAFNKPVVEPPSTLSALTGPVLNLLKQIGRLIPGGECEVFYAGSVAPPK